MILIHQNRKLDIKTKNLNIRKKERKEDKKERKGMKELIWYKKSFLSLKSMVSVLCRPKISVLFQVKIYKRSDEKELQCASLHLYY